MVHTDALGRTDADTTGAMGAAAPAGPVHRDDRAAAPDLGRRVRDALERTLGAERVRRHLGAGVRLEQTGAGLEVRAPDPFTLDMIERRLGGALRDALGDLTPGRDAALSFAVEAREQGTGSTTRRPGSSSTESAATGQAPAPARDRAPRRGPARRPRPGLEAFVGGACNEIALSAVLQCLGSGGDTAPVLVHGACGLGKTHLLRGAADRMRAMKPGAKVVESSGDAFTSGFVGAVKRREVAAFERRFHGIDLLCLDDVHLLAGKTQTQNELLQIFETLSLKGARVIIASDAPPGQIGRINAALASRLSSGIVARLDPPDRETGERLALSLARRHGVTLDPRGVGLILDRVGIGRGVSVRELEGAILQIKAVTACTHAAGADLASIARALDLRGSGRAGAARRGPIPLELIVRVVCEELGVSAGEFRAGGRNKRVVLAREMCVHGAKSLTNASYPEIARAMGRPNHSSVITAYNRAAQRIERGDPIDKGSDRSYTSVAAGLLDRVRAVHDAG